MVYRRDESGVREQKLAVHGAARYGSASYVGRVGQRLRNPSESQRSTWRGKPMSNGTALLDAIQRDPDNNGLRLSYAEWCDDNYDCERAEFIRIQIDAESHTGGSAQHAALTYRAIELLRKNGSRWVRGYETAAPPDAVVSVHNAKWAGEHGIKRLKGRKDREGLWIELHSELWFRRGFVDEIALTPERFFSVDACNIRPEGPVPTLQLRLCHRNDQSLGTLADFASRLASAPLLRRFRDVSIVGGFGSTTSEGLRLLASQTGLLAKLSGLWLSEDPVDESVVLPILDSPNLTTLRQLALDDTECTWAILEPLVRSKRFRGMTYLNLSEIVEGARGLRVFATPGRWPRLQGLALSGCGLDDLTLRGLMRPRAFPDLEVLELAHNDVHARAVRALLLSGAVPRLRKLGVGGLPLTLDEVNRLREEFGQRVEIGFPVPRRRSAS
jgi:uncharacterized protein (TIGR02996 family)